jgi:hypothetical protein
MITFLWPNGTMEWNLSLKYFPQNVYEFESRIYYKKNTFSNYFVLKSFYVTSFLKLGSKYEWDGYVSDILLKTAKRHSTATSLFPISNSCRSHENKWRIRLMVAS